MASPVTAPWPEADTYLTAHYAEMAGKYGDAVTAYTKCAADDTPLAPYARVRAAYCRGLAGDFDGAMKDYDAALPQGASGPWVRMAQAQRASLLVRHGQHAEAAALYAGALSVSPKRWWLDAYEWQAAENCMATPETLGQGFAFYRGVLATTRRRDPRVQAALKLSVSPSNDDRLLAVAAFLRGSANKEAAVCMATVPAGAIEAGEQTARYQYLMGRLLIQTNQVPKGREAFQQALAAAPSTPWARLALSHLARSYVTTNEAEAAAAAFAQLLNDYPDTEETGDALWWYAERLAGSKTPKPAIAQYALLATTCPSHERADDAQLAAGRLAKSLGSKDESLRLFGEFAKRFPSSPLLSEALFWSGRLREAGGDAKGARADYARAAKTGLGNYYGHRAFERASGLGDKKAASCPNLKVDGKRSFVRPLPIAADAPTPVPAELTDDPRSIRLRFFAAHGLEEAEWEALELAQTPRTGEGETEAWYQFLGESGLAFSAWELADAAKWGQEQGQATLARQRLSYARAYRPILVQIGKDTGVDPFLVAAVARQESTFRPALTSSAGARGVMQIMPGTAKAIVKSNPEFAPEDAERLEDPTVALRMGASYLSSVLERSNGNVVYAVASYNAGPGNVSKWRKANPSADLETFVEMIPFAETRDYVKRVLGNYAAYHSLYAGVD
ncbi:MAG: transglycosylase SLT domain-containing protein [Candidatus Hydrogenedentes bacterium]|nr:transglycosylase SLT domain-containing protein [Candidatus Hydrogenedentota bacterium]